MTPAGYLVYPHDANAMMGKFLCNLGVFDMETVLKNMSLYPIHAYRSRDFGTLF